MTMGNQLSVLNGLLVAFMPAIMEPTKEVVILLILLVKMNYRFAFRGPHNSSVFIHRHWLQFFGTGNFCSLENHSHY